MLTFNHLKGSFSEINVDNYSVATDKQYFFCWNLWIVQILGFYALYIFYSSVRFIVKLVLNQANGSFVNVSNLPWL